MAAVARDAALPVWLLAEALASELTAAGCGNSSSDGGLIAARQLLQQLPAGQQVLLPLQLLGAAMGEQQQQQQQHNTRTSSSRLLLPELSITAAVACMFRSSAGQHRSPLRQQWLQQQLLQVAAAAQAAGSKCSRSLALSQLLQQLLPMVSQQPWSSTLQQLLQQEQGQQQQQLALLLPLLQQAACHAAIAAAAGAASAAAVAAGAASPYQESVWRSNRPTERARSEASHPAVDGLQPCLVAVAAFEGSALQQLLQHVMQNTHSSSSSSSSSNVGRLAAQIHGLQLARSSVWDAVHGPLHLHYSSTAQQHAAAVVAAVQPEQLAWAWSKLAKAVERLLTSCNDVAAAESAARWQFLQQQMAVALQLDAAAPKPLMWQLAGHPQLPPNRQLLAAQQKAAALADALAVQNGAGFRVDARGQPAGLIAAGVDWQQLLQEAVQTVQEQLQQYRLQQQHINTNAADADGEGAAAGFNDVAAVLEGLELGTGAGAELRERLSAAAAAVLCCDVGLRRGVTQGLAMIGFLPHMQLLQQQQGSAAASVGGVVGTHGAAAESLAAVPGVLQQQVAALLQPLLIQLLSAPQQQQHEATGAAAVVAALKQQTSSAGLASSSMQLLPASAMVSAAARQMQVDLQQLLHTASAKEEGKVAAAALGWLLSAAASKATASSAQQQQQLVLPVLPKQQLQQLQGRLQQYLATSGAACCQRSAAALVPLQQLSWLIGSLLDDRQALPQQQLLQQVLPGILHDAWFSWQAGLWAGSSNSAEQLPHQQGSGLSSSDASALFGFMRGLSIPARVTSSPLCLHLASRTAAVLQICAAGAADGTSKAARLQQLSLAAQQLQQQQQPQDSSSSQQQQVLGLLLGQLLLAHISSFSSSDAAVLKQHVQQLLVWCSSSSAAAPDHNTVMPWLQQLADVLSRSSHSTLTAVAQPLLLPCAEAILLPNSSSSSNTQPQHQQQWHSQLGTQGWAWLLLGCARLQLVAPPPGVDPAGRFGYKANAMQSWVSTQLEPAIQVHAMLQQLPGGPDESASLQLLTQQHVSFTAKLQKLRSRCVPRPDPPAYLHLQQEVAAFSRGLADPQRLVTVGKALLQSCSNAAAAAGGSAVREAEMWDGSAAAWAKRMRASFADYIDVLQPVLLSLLEARHGLALLSAASQAAQQAAAADATAQSSSGQLMALTAGLLSFPPPLAGVTAEQRNNSSSSSVAVNVVPASLLADPRWQKLTGNAVQQQQQQLQGRSAAAAAASTELADFGWQLRTVHAALVVAVQEHLAAGPAAAAAKCSGTSDGGSLGDVDSMLQQVLSVWQAVRAYEAAAAEEAAQLFKHKTHTSTFVNEEVSGCLLLMRIL
jgi:midasin